MYGPVLQKVTKDPHLYFINMCTRQSSSNSNLTCFDSHGATIRSFACQRTTNGYAVNLGSTLGFGPPENETQLGLIVTFTDGKHSSGCALNGHSYRSTKLSMVCDPSAGRGEPEAPEDQTVEFPHHTCQYNFIWRSLYACPLCTELDHYVVPGECSNQTRTREIHYVWNAPKMCHDGFPLPETKIESCTPARGGVAEATWYTTPAFLISVIVVGSLCFILIVAWSLVKYYKYRKLYEAYAQLDRDRGMAPEQFDGFPTDLELELDETPLPSLGGRL